MSSQKPRVEDVLPLSPLQEGFLFHALYDRRDEDDVYTIQYLVGLDGVVDAGRLERAVTALMARHANLRVSFRQKKSGETVQVVPQEVVTPFRVVDGDGDEAVRSAATTDRAPFSLARPPLVRFTLVRCPDERNTLVVTAHHILVDGWSLPVMFREVFALYAAEGDPTDLPSPAPYKDYLSWLAGRDAAEDERFWREAFAGLEDSTLVATPDAERVPMAPATVRTTLPEAFTARLEEFCRGLDITVNTAVRTAWSMVVGQLAGRADVVVGATVSGRPPQIPGIEAMVGLFINTIPVRVRLDPCARVKDVLAGVHADSVAALDHQYTRLSDIRRYADVGELFDALMVFENYPLDPSSVSLPGTGLQVRSIDGRDATHYPLTLVVLPGDSVTLRLDHRPDLFTTETAQALLERVQDLLRTFVNHPDLPLAALCLATARERSDVAGWDGGAASATESRRLERLFEDAVDEDPASPCLVHGERTWTYVEVDEIANRLGRLLRERGAGPERTVALLLPRSVHLVVAALAAIKSGAAYLPVDPDYPTDRVAYMVEDSAPVLVLAPPDVDVPAGPEVLRVDLSGGPEELAPQYPTTRLVDGLVDGPTRLLDHPAYVIYTSGSTGRPKGVVVTHRGIGAFADAIEERFAAGRGDRVLQFASPSFDASVLELVLAWGSGATLVVPTSTPLVGETLTEQLDEGGVTHALIPPAVLGGLEVGEAPRSLVVGGDATSAELVRAWAPGRRMVNAYGPTESTVVTTTGRPLDAESGTPTIGTPVPGTRVHVLDRHLQPVGVGVAGELYIAGEGLARGYHGRPDLTAERFVADPFGPAGSRMYRSGDLVAWTAEGELRFLGRADDQVKVRGFRIEPGEIEGVLAQEPSVRQVVVVVREDTAGVRQLVAYVVRTDGSTGDTVDLQELANRVLPDHMVPAAFVELDAMPLTANGSKIDRRALPAPTFRSAGFGRAPRTEAEETLVQVFAEVLGVPEVGVDDSFFELGGDSIMSIQLVSRARKAGLSLSPKDVFARRTPAALAAGASPATGTPVQDDDGVGEVPLTPIVHWLRELGGPIAGFHQSAVITTPPQVDESVLLRALDALVDRHDALRLRLHRTDEYGPWNLEVRPRGSVQAAELLHRVEVRAGADLGEMVAEQQKTAAALLDPDAGVMLRAVHLDAGEHPGRLLLLVHHLAVDGVSWRILLPDLAAAAQDALSAGTVQVDPVGTSLRSWATHLVEDAQSAERTRELPLWREMSAPVDSIAERPLDPERDSVATLHSLRCDVPSRVTEALLGMVPALFNAEVDDVLLTALALALASWRRSKARPESATLVTLEKHGREDVLEGADLSRTVGWFTSMFPIRLDLRSVDFDAALAGGPQVASALKGVKEVLRRVPHHGLGYGMLRHLNVQTGSMLARLGDPEIGFNYLGRFGAPDGRLWGPAPETSGLGGGTDPDARVPHVLEVGAWTEDSEAGPVMSATWSWPDGVLAEDDVRYVMGAWVDALEAVVAHASTPGAGGRSPSDVPLVAIDQAGLDLVDASIPTGSELLPLTPMQEGLLFHSLYDTSQDDVYTVQMAVDVSGPLDVETLRDAARRVLSRHAALRTGFVHDGLATPVAFVPDEVPLHWREVTVSDEQEAAEAVAQDRTRRFDLTAPPHIRFLLVRHSAERATFVITNHHILFDGWSMPIIVGDLLRAYSGEEMSTPTPIEGYHRWRARQDHEASREAWTRALEGVEDATLLAGPRPGGQGGDVGHDRVRVVLDHDHTRALGDLARRRGVTTNTVVQACWGLLLSRMTGRRDVVFGATTSGRPGELAGVESMVGLFINTLPVRVRIEPGDTLADVLERLQERQAELLEHQYLSLPEIQNLVRAGELFDTLTVFENYPLDVSEHELAGGVRLTNARVDDATHYPMTLVALPGDRLDLTFVHRTDVVENALAVRLSERMCDLLELVCADPDRRVRDIDLLSPGERADVLHRWQGDDTREPATAPTVLARFDAVVAEHGEDTAITGPRTLTYAQLHEEANRLAHRLVAMGVQPEDKVAILQERSVELVIATLAVLRAGAAYVPMDARSPRNRLEQILTVTAPAVLVVDRYGLDEGLGHGVPVLRIEDAELDEMPATAPEVTVQEDSLAYVMFTSGSTGTPKGVAVTHRNVVDLAADGSFDGDNFTSVLMHSPHAFDASTFEVWVPLLRGGRIVVAPPGELDIDDLAEALLTSGVTGVWLTAGLFRVLAEERLDCFAAVREVWSGGDLVPAGLARAVMERNPGLRFGDGYGPTETTTFATRHVVDDPAEIGSALPIGTPLDRTRVLVLDDLMNPVPPGVPGELFIGGTGLARGYLDRPDLTAERFVADPFGDGSRLYRTGDLVSWRPDASGRSVLHFLGRSDEQVKIRGFRIELGEIEATVAARPQVAQTAVIVREDRPGEKRLVAYVTPEGVDKAALREQVAAELPEFMVPSAFVVLNSLPLTRNKKVDRRALPAVPEDDEGHREPTTELERRLCELFAAVLGRDRVGVDDDFFTLGGHSLLATRLVSRVRTELDAELPIRALFESPTPAALAEQVEAAAKARLPLRHYDRPDDIPGSFGQRRLWFIDRLAGGDSPYKIPIGLRIVGDFDQDAFEAALGDVVAKHEVLRTVFGEVDGDPVQVVLAADQAGPELDRRRVTEEEAAAILLEETGRGFDLSTEMPLRAFSLQVDEDEYRVLLLVHHIAADGWSMAPMAKDLSDAYAARRSGHVPELPELPVQYADYSLWQQEVMGAESDEDSEISRQIAYWRETLAGLPEELTLPTDRPRPDVSTHRGGVITFDLDATLHAGVVDLARRTQTSPFMVLQAALAAALTRMGAGTDIPIGSPIAGRGDHALDDLVGFFVNTLVLRTDTAGDPTFRELLGRVREVVLAAYAHQDLPFERLVDIMQPARVEGRNPLFQVLLTLQNNAETSLSMPGIDVTVEPVGVHAAQFDLSFDFTDRFTDGIPDGMTGRFDYSLEMFDEAGATAILDRLVRLLRAVVAEPDTRLGAIDILGADERRLLMEFTETDAPEEFEDLVAVVRRMADARPDHPALIDDDRAITYAQLARRAGALSARLAEDGVRPGDIAAVLSARSVHVPVAMLGILGAGAAYTPLDPSAPPARSAAMLADSGARWILTEPASVDLARQLAADGDVELVVLDGAENDAPPEPAGTPADLAYVIFTSGSTGRPKGAMVHRRGMANHLLAKVDDLGLTGDDVVVANAPLSFDISIWQMLCAFVVGGTTRVVPEETATDAEALFATADRDRVTILEVVPSLLRTVLDVWGERRPELRALRRLVVTGEALPAPLCERWLALYPQIPLVNAYGPTECSDDVTHALIDTRPDLGSRVPIGKAVRNTRLYVLDDLLEPVSLGVSGELCVGGVGVGYGYLGDPVKTARAFVPDPFCDVPGSRLYRTGDRARFRPDGTLEFLGREDHQVKIRGRRIELGEVEAALQRVEGVSDAVVTVRAGAGGQDRLVGYVVGDLEAEHVRRELRDLLPSAMIPAAVVTMPSFPLTRNGKIDRAALPDPDLGVHEGRAPRTEVERTLCDAFADVLGLSEVSVDDDFFDLGGHSLLVTRLVNRLRTGLGVEVPVRLVFTEPTVAGLAANLSETASAGRALVAGPRPEVVPLSFEQRRLWFINKMEDDPGTYNVPVVLRIRGDLDVDALVAAIGDVVARHESLRTLFPDVAGVPRQHVLPVEQARPDVEVREVPRADSEAVITEFCRRGFDLERQIPIRATVLRAAEDSQEHHVVVVVHHISSDFGSAAPLHRDLADAYAARHAGHAPDWEPLAVQYADYTLWQAERMGEETDPDSPISRQLAHWTTQLADLPESLELPTDRPRPVETDFAAGVVPVDLDAALHARLETVALAHGASLAMVMQAGLAVLLSRMGAGTDIPIGAPVAGRSDEALDELVGFFVNTLVLRTDVSGNPTFAELLERVKQGNLAAFAHQDTPFERIVEALNPTRSMTMHPLVQVVLSFQNHMPVRLELPGLEIEGVATPPAGAKFDLSVKVGENRDENGEAAGITGQIEYRQDLFDASSIELLVRRFRRVLQSFADDPSRRPADPDILLDGEYDRLVVEWNDTATQDPVRCAHTLVERQAALTPDLLALADGEIGLTYGDLNSRANAFARGLLAHGVGAGDVVAVTLPRSIDLVVALLAVLKTGAAYAPVDPDYPRERIERMLEGAGAPVTVTRQDVRGAIPERFPVALVDDMDGETRLTNITDAERRRPVGLHDAAYVIFTSGSTGTPKGVVVEHYSLSDYLEFAADDYDGVRGLALLHSSISFDLSVTSMWVPLVVGGAVLLTSFEEVDPRVVESLRRRPVSFVKATPSHLPLLAVLPEEYSPTHELLLGGERLLGDMVEPFRTAHPDVTVFNMYGPTETTVNCTEYRVPAGAQIGGGPLPIGAPLPNTRCYVLDERLSVVPIGVAGELYVAGNCLARGYLGRPDLTASKFVADPFGGRGDRMYRTGDVVRWNVDGTLSFLRRADDQVQLRGFRIELGEVEGALTAHADVSRAAAVIREDRPGDPRLVAYVTVVREVSAADLRTFAAARLPEYMTPSAIVVLDELPLTPNRKVDRFALPAPTTEGSSRPPRTQRERVVAELFADALGLPSVGIDDSFFDLGGHSLLATRLIARLREVLGVQLTLRSLFEAPTVAQLATRVEGEEDDPFESLLPLRRHGSASPLFCVHPASGFGWSYGGLLRHLPADVPLYALQSAGLDGEGELPGSVEEAARSYLVHVRAVQPHGPYRLLGWSFGGMIAHAMTQQLERDGEEVELLAMLDSFPKSDEERSTPLRIDEGELLHVMLGLAGYGEVLARITGNGAEDGIDRVRLVELLREEGGVLGDITEDRLAAIYEVFVNNSRLAREFHPGVAEVGAVLYVATADEERPHSEQAWAGHVGRVDRVDVDSAHNDMTNPRQIAFIGADLHTRLTHEEK